jgi:hypothetical protein
MNAVLLFASRSARDWQANSRPFARNDADRVGVARTRLYKEVQS